MYTHEHAQSNVGHYLGYVEKEMSFFFLSGSFAFIRSGRSPSWRGKARELKSPQSFHVLSSPAGPAGRGRAGSRRQGAAAFTRLSPARSCQRNSGPCPCALSCGERSGRVSSSLMAGSPPPAASGEPRPGRGGGPACCQVEAAGSTRSSGSGRSSSAGCLSWA